jgi:hypothetical protein
MNKDVGVDVSGPHCLPPGRGKARRQGVHHYCHIAAWLYFWGFRVRVQGLGFKVCGLWFMVQGLGFKV